MISLAKSQFFYLSTVVLFVSTLVHCIELIIVPDRFLNLVYPNAARGERRKKKMLWLWLHIVLSSVTGIILVLLLTGGFTLLLNCILFIQLVLLYISYRIRKVGKDGADQMRILLLIMLLVASFAAAEDMYFLFLVFSGIQVLIAYATSGFLKLCSPWWRKGDVLAGILKTYSFGYNRIGVWLQDKPRMEKLLAHTAIACMLSPVIMMFCPAQEGILIALLCMLLFHACTAVLMGLSDFLLTFPATYAGVIFLHSIIWN